MSKIKQTIRTKASSILDISIQKGKWTQYIDLIDREGKFGKKQTMAILIALCESIEDIETYIEDLYFQIENKPKNGKTS